jgi:hypothetical protein
MASSLPYCCAIEIKDIIKFIKNNINVAIKKDMTILLPL